MNRAALRLAPLALLLALSGPAPASAQAQNFSVEDLARRTVERRAVEAVIWGMPAVNADLMLQEAIKARSGRATHAFIRNMERFSRSSQTPGLQKNADGSVDVYFGPKPPAGKESNWVPTNPSGQFEVLFRFYGPEKPLFDKTWVLPDIEKVSGQ